MGATAATLELADAKTADRPVDRIASGYHGSNNQGSYLVAIN